MIQAFDVLLQIPVTADIAAKNRIDEPFRYECLCCGEEVYIAATNSTKKAPHFRHRRGNSDRECELYLGSTGIAGALNAAQKRTHSRTEIYFDIKQKIFYAAVSFPKEKLQEFEDKSCILEFHSTYNSPPYEKVRINHQNTVVNLNEDGSLSAQELMKFCFQVECLYENDEISYRTLNRLLKDGIGRFSGRRPLNASAQSSLRQSDSVHGQITRDVIQAVGRMGRTFLKNPSVYLFTTEKTLYDLDLACLNGRILNPEMEALRKARIDLGGGEICIDHTHNKAERKATRGNAYILRMLNVDWTEETMALWKSLRQTVLQHPRAGHDALDGNSMIRTYYIPLAQDRHCYFYAQKGDFSEVILSCGQDKMQFAASLPEGLFPSTVSEEEARLAQILSYPGLKEHFINRGWATEFGTGPYIMSPVLFQNIYKGALGEVAGKFILEKELGLILQEIEDPEKFESFDFVTDGDVFFDFKHWKWNMQVEESPMRAKVLKKLDAVGGKKAFIVNLFSDGVSRPSCSNDGRLIEVPGILLPTGQLDQPALDYIRRFLL